MYFCLILGSSANLSKTYLATLPKYFSSAVYAAKLKEKQYTLFDFGILVIINSLSDIPFHSSRYLLNLMATHKYK